MPKTGGSNIDECMEICMTDPALKKEEPDSDKRKSMCYAACDSYINDNDSNESNETQAKRLNTLIRKILDNK